MHFKTRERVCFSLQTLVICGGIKWLPPLCVWHRKWVTAESWMSFLLYLGDPVLLTLMEFLGFMCLKLTVNILKLQGKGWLGEQVLQLLCLLFSFLCVCPAPGLTKDLLEPPSDLAFGRKISLPFCRWGLGSEESKEAPSQLMCQVKWLGQDLNSNLFTLDHVFFSINEYMYTYCMEKKCIHVNERLNSWPVSWFFS